MSILGYLVLYHRVDYTLYNVIMLSVLCTRSTSKHDSADPLGDVMGFRDSGTVSAEKDDAHL